MSFGMPFPFISTIACLCLLMIHKALACPSNQQLFPSSSPLSSVFLPFLSPVNLNSPPFLRVTIFNTPILFPVDTGSTGILLGHPKLPFLDTTGYPPAHSYLSSSNFLYTGSLVPLTLTFNGSNDYPRTVTSTVPVLIVDAKTHCPWYNPLTDAGTCPPNPSNHSDTGTALPTAGISYMGVGFGRNTGDGEQPHGIPALNPFLNIDSIDDVPVDLKSWHAGYIINTTGVTLGLTPNNTEDFAWAKLKPGITHAEDSRDWAMPSMCVRVNDEPEDCGAALVDTGIAQMYLRRAVGRVTPNHTLSQPTKRRVDDGVRIAVGFLSSEGAGEEKEVVAGYEFVAGEGSKMEPVYVVPETQKEGKARAPFVNTGRAFLFGYEVAFDAEAGRFGLREVVGGGDLV
ncbi:uncharacterized protein BDZ99DRAFT_461908 [Mytilinidion resinicola]|uniref:Acid protease n=1 Tax=Mytilinidion resinicola TaxID=574789 RepID=A0A6A6YT21_9PEZI|nr:uncharacterized protein BDZ99DRAFT_461908 [Mytilinidion resinicola]KAF2811960.1 hypothetical protein BDZ99DRAFT_461908 [Mytilinidion resinicola]